MAKRDLTFKCPFDKKICIKSPGTQGNRPRPAKLMFPFDEEDSIFNPDNDTGRKCGRNYDWRLDCRRFEQFLNDECTDEKPITEEKLQKSIKNLTYMFKQLVFPTNIEKRILFDSYLLNIKDMILYAKTIEQSPYDYIKSIKKELLKNPNVRER